MNELLIQIFYIGYRIKCSIAIDGCTASTFILEVLNNICFIHPLCILKTLFLQINIYFVTKFFTLNARLQLHINKWVHSVWISLICGGGGERVGGYIYRLYSYISPCEKWGTEKNPKSVTEVFGRLLAAVRRIYTQSIGKR